MTSRGAVSCGLGKRLRKAADGTTTALAEIAAGDRSGVHKTRKEIKRLRSLIRLIRPVIGDREARSHDRALGAAARSLAGVRRAEAAHEAMAKIASSLGVEAEADLRKVLGFGIVGGAVAHAATLPLPGAAALAPARSAVMALRTAAKARASRRRDREIFAAVARTYGRTRKLLRQGLADGKTLTLHRARKSLIRLLHQLEAIAPGWPAGLGLAEDAVNALREELGDLNDLADIEAALVASRVAAGPAAMAIAERRRQLLEDAAKGHQRLFATGRKAFRKRLKAGLLD